MATILFAAAGAALGAGFGGSVLGLSGAVIGRALGATVGRAVDQRIMGIGSDAVEVGKLDRFHVMGASEGAPIAKFWGRMRLAGQVIWASPFRETSRRTGGKGMPSPKTVHFSYSVSLAIALCEGEILGIGRIWADGDEISPRSLNLRVYNGTEDQIPDPLIEAQVGNANAPAYRGIAYVVIEDLELSIYGNRVPQFSFEVLRRAQGAEAENVPDLQDAIRAVALIPGTGEYALATTKVREERGFGDIRTINVNSPSGYTDLTTSLKQLKQELPKCQAVSLIVSWFGSDLRCASCEIQPKVEQKVFESSQMPWRAGGIGRSQAQEVPRIDGRSIYGGTPADASVLEAIAALRDIDQSVMFYPFILMDQIGTNTLPDPYSDNEFQAELPWRGRITLSTAPGREFTPDRTEAALHEVSAFFGTAGIDDFTIQNREIQYHGESKWGYRRFILHYAFLCQIAGGVESFCIGSEMRSLTRIRGPEDRFPAVEALVQLAADVRIILGPSVKISYAADWSEYFGLHVDGNVYFHLDPLWASDHIDFIGIDNYMPISDWREGSFHADSNWKSIYNIEYLKSNIAGGEGFDWYYSSPEGVERQNRIPIKDESNGEDWVFRYKDLKSWWAGYHHDRVDGIRSEHPTDWIPQSKPIRFTEYGCAAIDKGTNEPNKFLDSRSSESSVPRFSSATRDDFIQMQYFRAFYQYWCDPKNNPLSSLYEGPMLDLDHCYAWAWDARPYPDFPRNIDVWSDGENYFLGHWLNGRVTAVPLERVVREICEDSGVQLAKTGILIGAVYGYSAVSIQSGRARLQPLEVVYGFNCFEDEGVLIFQSREVSEVVKVSQDDIVLSQNNTPFLEIIRSSSEDSISRVRFSFLGVDGNFSVSVAEAIDSTAPSTDSTETEYPIVLPIGFAKATANRWLFESDANSDQVSIGLPLSKFETNSGSSILLNGLTYRIDRCDFDNKYAVRAVRTESSLYGKVYRDVELPYWESHIEGGPVSRIWMDIPIINENQTVHAPFLAVASNVWTRPVVLWSSEEDAGYVVNSNFTESSHIGITLSDLMRSPLGVFDRGAPLLIKMHAGFLETASLLGLLSGKNILAIGDGSPERWEILQFLSAELHSPGVYSVSLRLRGLAGTDLFLPEVWPAESKVVLINDQLKRISLSSAALNIQQHYRLGFLGENIGSELVQHDVMSFKGSGLRPLSVCHLKFQIDDYGNHCFRWLRRTRVGGDSWEAYDVQIGEERELYSFVVESASGDTILSEIIENSEYCYSLYQRIAGGIVGSYSVKVSQVSLSYGLGPGRRLDIII